MTRQPKKSVSERRVLEELDWDKIEKVLNRSRELLWQGGVVSIPILDLSEALLQALQAARSSGQLVGGLEAIETLLQREQLGLEKNGSVVSKKSLAAVSRLLLLSNDGSERFYRSAENMQKRFGARLLLCRLNAKSDDLGRLFGSNANVKALLVARKEFVSRVLAVLTP